MTTKAKNTEREWVTLGEGALAFECCSDRYLQTFCNLLEWGPSSSKINTVSNEYSWFLSRIQNIRNLMYRHRIAHRNRLRKKFSGREPIIRSGLLDHIGWHV